MEGVRFGGVSEERAGEKGMLDYSRLMKMAMCPYAYSGIDIMVSGRSYVHISRGQQLLAWRFHKSLKAGTHHQRPSMRNSAL